MVEASSSMLSNKTNECDFQLNSDKSIEDTPKRLFVVGSYIYYMI